MKQIFTLLIVLTLALGTAPAQSSFGSYSGGELIENLSVYPNPSSTGNFSVKFRINAQQDRVNVKVYNLIGRQVFQEQVSGQGNEFKTSFSLSHLPQGFYMLEVVVGDKRITRRLSFS